MFAKWINRVLSREHTGHSKHPFPATQVMTLHMDIIQRSIPTSDDYILCSWRSSSSIQPAKTRLGADCGSDHESLIAKFKLKLKKARKTTRPFRYGLNQIPYNYTVQWKWQIDNRFKGLDLKECLKNYARRFITLYRRQWSKPSLRKRNAKKAKRLSEEALQTAEKRREAKAKEKRKDVPIWIQSSRKQQGERRKPS